MRGFYDKHFEAGEYFDAIRESISAHQGLKRMHCNAAVNNLLVDPEDTYWALFTGGGACV